MNKPRVIVVGSGNAALCAGISALEKGASVLMLEKGDESLAGGNTKYTAGAMRFTYNSLEDLMPLLKNQHDPRLSVSEFGSYSHTQFQDDLLKFNNGKPLTVEQKFLIEQSYPTICWLANHGVKFEPIYSRQSFQKNERFVFWGGLTLATEDEGVGLFEQELNIFKKLGGEIQYESPVEDLLIENSCVVGVITVKSQGKKELRADGVVLGCGGFEANQELRVKYLGDEWAEAKVRGTPHNTGDGIVMAKKSGGMSYGNFNGCHATPMDLHMKPYGGLDLEPKERKNYRKICYFLGVMLNVNGERFVDEGSDYRNYTYAQFGREILKQPKQKAYQIFDSKVFDLLYEEYHFHDAHFIEGDSLEKLIYQIEDIDQINALKTLAAYNKSVNEHVPFDPTVKDAKSTEQLALPKSNWAQKLDTPPFRVYPVTGGITFTYGGLKISDQGEVLNHESIPIPGLYACGELVGGVFLHGYPGGSGLTSGAVFGKVAGASATRLKNH